MTALEVDVLSSSGGLSRIHKTQSAGGWAFDTTRLNSHVRARGAFAKGHIVLLTVAQGGEADICGVPLENGVILMLPVGAEITACIRGKVIYSASVLRADIWAEIFETATGQPGETVLSQPRARREGPEDGCAIATSLMTAQQSFEGADRHYDEMPGSYLDYLGAVALKIADTDSFGRYLNRSLRQRLKQARQGEDIIRENLNRPLPVMSICRTMGVSRRQLEYAFHTAFGVGPREYTHLLRLNESRRQLRQARTKSGTVTEIAMGVGVTHLGRFAESYRFLFGETPIQTLRGGR
ncbi:MAG: helix-turn-helix domain-containing protein [Rhizobiaceae bacterium]|nr:helix-turn-helix domain-containing protein [Rhizobiaceae bacterium]